VFGLMLRFPPEFCQMMHWIPLPALTRMAQLTFCAQSELSGSSSSTATFVPPTTICPWRPPLLLVVLLGQLRGVGRAQANGDRGVRTPGPDGGRAQRVRTFDTFLADLEALRDWLIAEGVTQVAPCDRPGSKSIAAPRPRCARVAFVL
jgi:hypothetical protein